MTTPTTWATLDDVTTITGHSIDESVLVQAQYVIEDYVGRTTGASGYIGPRDAEWLRRAVARQAAWMPHQPGYHSRSGVTGINQDGLNTTYADKSSRMLAPGARRALTNVSWLRSRSLALHSSFTSGDRSFEAMRADADDGGGWAPVS